MNFGNSETGLGSMAISSSLWWRLDWVGHDGVRPNEVWKREFLKKYKCKECGTLSTPAENDTVVVPVVGPEPQIDISGIWWIGVRLWRQELFRKLQPFLPPIVQYRIDAVPGWKHKWTAFNVHPTYRVRDYWDGFEYTACAACGQFTNRGFLSQYAPWYKAKDLQYQICEGVMNGIIVSNTLKRTAPLLETASIVFNSIEVRNID